MLRLAASPVGHERGAIVFQALVRETTSEARISDPPCLPNRVDAEFGTGLTVALSTTPRRHARYDGRRTSGEFD